MSSESVGDIISGRIPFDPRSRDILRRSEAIRDVTEYVMLNGCNDWRVATRYISIIPGDTWFMLVNGYLPLYSVFALLALCGSVRQKLLTKIQGLRPTDEERAESIEQHKIWNAIQGKRSKDEREFRTFKPTDPCGWVLFMSRWVRSRGVGRSFPLCLSNLNEKDWENFRLKGKGKKKRMRTTVEEKRMDGWERSVLAKQQREYWSLRYLREVDQDKLRATITKRFCKGKYCMECACKIGTWTVPAQWLSVAPSVFYPVCRRCFGTRYGEEITAMGNRGGGLIRCLSPNHPADETPPKYLTPFAEDVLITGLRCEWCNLRDGDDIVYLRCLSSRTNYVFLRTLNQYEAQLIEGRVDPQNPVPITRIQSMEQREKNTMDAVSCRTNYLRAANEMEKYRKSLEMLGCTPESLNLQPPPPPPPPPLSAGMVVAPLPPRPGKAPMNDPISPFEGWGKRPRMAPMDQFHSMMDAAWSRSRRTFGSEIIGRVSKEGVVTMGHFGGGDYAGLQMHIDELGVSIPGMQMDIDEEEESN